MKKKKGQQAVVKMIVSYSPGKFSINHLNKCLPPMVSKWSRKDCKIMKFVY